ncbi:MAG TPA: DUF3806 domain-containing protein [Frankiaceae bacterium]|nr:DUF3806 domain-containing protein [Frankiaceae bacterium]
MIFRKRAKPSGPKVAPLTPAENTWRDQQLLVARAVAERYTGASEDPPSLERLDATVAAWLADDDTRVDVNTLVNAVGIAFGWHLAGAAGLGWVIATDEHGTDLALHRAAGDVLVFPANVVAKRVVAGETGFVRALFESYRTALPPAPR